MTQPRTKGNELISQIMDEFETMSADFRHLFAERLRPHHLTLAQFFALDVIARSKSPVSLTAIGGEIGAPPSSMTSIADRLEQGGLIVRRPNPADRRSFTVEATQQGKNVMREVRFASEADLEYALTDLPNKDLEVFLHVLRHSHRRIQERERRRIARVQGPSNQ